MTSLTDFQVRVARVFFELPESDGFLVAGGAALIAHDLVNRPTRDLDLFSSPRKTVSDTVIAFESAAAAQGWKVRRVHDHDQFVRLLVAGPEDLIVDIGVDAAPQRTPTMCMLGPSYDPLELAGRKLLALFDRAEARDFTDTHALINLYGVPAVLAFAQELDPGLSARRLADSLTTIDRFVDADFPIPGEDVPAMREFFDAWAGELRLVDLPE